MERRCWVLTAFSGDGPRAPAWHDGLAGDLLSRFAARPAGYSALQPLAGSLPSAGGACGARADNADAGTSMSTQGEAR